jgi:hypothetical protein
MSLWSLLLNGQQAIVIDWEWGKIKLKECYNGGEMKLERDRTMSTYVIILGQNDGPGTHHDHSSYSKMNENVLMFAEATCMW